MSTDTDQAPGTIIECRYLVVSATEVIENAAVAYRGNVIVDTGEADDVIARLPGFTRVGSRETTIAMPGLINSHHHGWGLSTLQFGVQDDYLEPWLIDLISLPPVDPYVDTMWSAMRQIRSGVTSVQHSAFVRSPSRFKEEIDASYRAYETLGMRALIAIQARDRNSYVYQDDEEFLATVPEGVATRVREAADKLPWPSWAETKELVLEYAAKFAKHSTLGVQICAEGPEWCTEELLRDISDTARAHQLRIHMHCLESPFQPVYLKEQYGMRAVEKLAEIGILGSHLSLAHAAWITEAELEICAREGVTLCHCPSSNLRLRNGIFPLEAARRAGVTVGIGLDSNTINDDDDMLQELRMALRLHRLPHPPGLTWAPSAADILGMATTGGAAAIGRGRELGALRTGMLADIVLVDAEALLHPYASEGLGIVDHIVTRATPATITDVIIDGETVLANGAFTRVDEARVGRELAEAARREVPEEHREWREAMIELYPYARMFYENWPAPPDPEPSYLPNSLT